MKSTLRKYFIMFFRIFFFFFFYIWEVIVANLKIAYEIITPRHNMRPGVVAIPLDSPSDLAIITLTNIITMTPGTLSLDVSMDRKVLYIHAIHIWDVESFRKEIIEGIMKKTMEIFE